MMKKDELVIRPFEGPVSLKLGGHVRHAPPNNLTSLPQLTVPFEVTPLWYNYELVSRCLDEELRTWDSKPVCVLLESKYPISPDTISLSLEFEHAWRLTTSKFGHCSGLKPTRIVRVIPTAGERCPRTFSFSLPTEILLEIFKATDSVKWQHDLLSFAQVCRQWSCSLRILFARLNSPEFHLYWCHPGTKVLDRLDPFALANALRGIPALGLSVQHLSLDQHNCCQRLPGHSLQKILPGFTLAAIKIFRTTRNLQYLDLMLGYSLQANILFSNLPELQDLHTLSITQADCVCWKIVSWIKYWNYTISTSQLACCMARLPALRSLTVEHIKPGNMGICQILLQQPKCALTQLCIHKAHISDQDLLYLTASSTSTLSQVALKEIYRLTNRGLLTFLEAISGTVVSLTIHSIVSSSRRKEEHALDVVVAKMGCLHMLDIYGDVASDRMLGRRSEMFMKSGCGPGMPVVRLLLYSVPEIDGDEDDFVWPGWQLVEFNQDKV